MVFGIFSQHLQVDLPPLPGKPAGSPSHGLLSLTPTGAVHTFTGSMPAPPLPQEPEAWGYETPSAKTRHSARSPAGEPLSGPKMPEVSMVGQAGVECTSGSMKPLQPVLALDPRQPQAQGGLVVPEMFPSVAALTQSHVPTVAAPPESADVPVVPVVPAVEKDVIVSVPPPETTLASAAYIAETIRQRRSKKNNLQKLRREGSRAGWVEPDDAALRKKTLELLRRKQQAKQAAKGTNGEKTTESTEPLGNLENAAEPGESGGRPVATQARPRGRPKSVNTLAREARARANEAEAELQAEAKEVRAKAKAKPKVKAQAETKAKAKAKTVSTSSSSRPDVQLQERVQVHATFAGRYVQDDDRWRVVLAGWGAAMGGGSTVTHCNASTGTL